MQRYQGFNTLSLFTTDRFILEDIYHLLAHLTEARQRARQIEIDVLNELISRKKFFIFFNSGFIDKGLEYILPRLKEGYSAAEIAEAIIREIPAADNTRMNRWVSIGNHLYPSKRAVIDKALGKYLSSKGLLGAIAGAKRKLGDFIRGTNKTRPQLSNGTRTEALENKSCRDIF